ncbi:MAG: 50S ribosomal protein L25 [Candidatus Omnitrophica bacterium]|nr:50S ribosomal protein L25 [Candidatus Omnitrophota bacterium]
MSARQKISSPQRPTLTVQPREALGTRVSRRSRLEGIVPGVVYGKKVKATAIAVVRKDLVQVLKLRTGEHGLVTLRLGASSSKAEAAAEWEKPALIKHVDHHPVTGDILHVDFQAILLTEQIRVKVPLALTGVSIGVKQDSGILEHFLRELEVECLPTEIPEQVAHDISAMKLGDTIHVRDLAAPAGVRILTEADSVVASVMAPKEEKPETEEAAITEPEVIREKKPEAEGEAAEAKPEKEEKKSEK